MIVIGDVTNERTDSQTINSTEKGTLKHDERSVVLIELIGGFWK